MALPRWKAKTNQTALTRFGMEDKMADSQGKEKMHGIIQQVIGAVLDIKV